MRKWSKKAAKIALIAVISAGAGGIATELVGQNFVTLADVSSPQMNTNAVTVHIKNFSFPGAINVTAGTTVTWVNDDMAAHTVTSGTDANGDAKPTGLFNMEVNPLQKVSYTFNKPGTYQYYCIYHPSMTGTVVVSAASTTGTTNTGTSGTSGPTTGNATTGTSSTIGSNQLTSNSSSSEDTSQMDMGNGANSSMPMQELDQKPEPTTLVRHGQSVTINMYTEETRVNIAPGVTFPAWTFDGTVPGPVLNLMQGDKVTLTLHNLDSQMAHSIDLHAALMDPSTGFTDVPPGKSKTITFTASLPGVFLYHCESGPMSLHMAQGMYGAVVVTPAGQKPPTYTIVQSEFYKPLDDNSVQNDLPSYVVFNGEANRYVAKPLAAKVGQPITVAFVNAGPNEFSAFHVVGSVLRDVQASGNPKNHLYDVQTYTVAPGDGALIHLEFDGAGNYTFVTHAMRDMDKGAMGYIRVTK